MLTVRQARHGRDVGRALVPARSPDWLLGAGLAADQRPCVTAGEGECEVEGYQPDRDDGGVHEVFAPRFSPDGFEEGGGIGKGDHPGPRRAQNPRVQVTHKPGGEGRSDDATDEECGDYSERYLRKAQREQEPKAGADGYDELARVYGTPDLARLHASATEKGRCGDGAPTSSAGRVQKPCYEAEGGEKPPRDRPLRDQVAHLEREADQDIDTEAEEEDRHDRLCRLRRDGTQNHRPQEGTNAPRNRNPADLAPVYVAEPPVRDPRRQRGTHLREVYRRRGRGRRYPHR